MTTFKPPADGPEAIDRARSLRETQSKSEAFLWDRLRSRRLNGVKFRRQYPVSPYTIDFYALQERVAIELDGELHEDRQAADARRDEALSRMGILTVRVTTAELFGNTEAALEKIWRHVQGR